MNFNYHSRVYIFTNIKMHTNKEPLALDHVWCPTENSMVIVWIECLSAERQEVTHYKSPVANGRTGMQCCCWHHSLFLANRCMEYLTPDVYLAFEICLCNISKHVSLTFLSLITVKNFKFSRNIWNVNICSIC